MQIPPGDQEEYDYEDDFFEEETASELANVSRIPVSNTRNVSRRSNASSSVATEVPSVDSLADAAPKRYTTKGRFTITRLTQRGDFYCENSHLYQKSPLLPYSKNYIVTYILLTFVQLVLFYIWASRHTRMNCIGKWATW